MSVSTAAKVFLNFGSDNAALDYFSGASTDWYMSLGSGDPNNKQAEGMVAEIATTSAISTTYEVVNDIENGTLTQITRVIGNFGFMVGGEIREIGLFSNSGTELYYSGFLVGNNAVTIVPDYVQESVRVEILIQRQIPRESLLLLEDDEKEVWVHPLLQSSSNPFSPGHQGQVTLLYRKDLLSSFSVYSANIQEEKTQIVGENRVEITYRLTLAPEDDFYYPTTLEEFIELRVGTDDPDIPGMFTIRWREPVRRVSGQTWLIEIPVVFTFSEVSV